MIFVSLFLKIIFTKISFLLPTSEDEIWVEAVILCTTKVWSLVIYHNQLHLRQIEFLVLCAFYCTGGGPQSGKGKMLKSSWYAKRFFVPWIFHSELFPLESETELFMSQTIEKLYVQELLTLLWHRCQVE